MIPAISFSFNILCSFSEFLWYVGQLTRRRTIRSVNRGCFIRRYPTITAATLPSPDKCATACKIKSRRPAEAGMNLTGEIRQFLFSSIRFDAWLNVSICK